MQLNTQRPAILDGDAVNITPEAVVGGLLVRTGLTDYSIDVFPSSVDFLKLLPEMTKGDVLSFIVSNWSEESLEFDIYTNKGWNRANEYFTDVVDPGCFLFCTATLVSDNVPAVGTSCTVTAASPVLSNIPADKLAGISPGMVVYSEAANFEGYTVLGVNLVAGTVTLDFEASENDIPLADMLFMPQLQVGYWGGTQVVE